jgi:hypothetical protein
MRLCVHWRESSRNIGRAARRRAAASKRPR